jgi:hypothetical protein
VCVVADDIILFCLLLLLITYPIGDTFFSGRGTLIGDNFFSCPWVGCYGYSKKPISETCVYTALLVIVFCVGNGILIDGSSQYAPGLTIFWIDCNDKGTQNMYSPY